MTSAPTPKSSSPNGLQPATPTRAMSQIKEAALPGNWREQALCRGLDRDTVRRLFFPRSPKSEAFCTEGLAFCQECPVREACLDEAIRCDEVGIWGGMTTDERRKYKRRLRYQKRKERAG